MSAISIIGMACRYADARSPRQLWENVLAQRRSFRRIPDVRLCLDDYSREGKIEDQIYLRTAAVLEDYEFDRVRFQVSKDTFASTDLAHWLALDVASQALEDARLLDASNSRRERIGVYVGNSLTGEFSRANLLRLRWPYVRRVLAAALDRNAACRNGDLHALLDEIEALYKSPFPATTEESLAGGLSNTIAGRICNYFNFKGGGYTVDGACASSLLAVTTACSALESGDVDIAIAGGVDLSLDPFELAGFSKLSALAHEKMRVFDAHSAGFWPGEGCGMVVLMQQEEAAAEHHSSYAVLRGWGISSDGNGGITRPEVSGQLLALRRAYQRAGYGMDTIGYFEGHGTGTAVGDATELQALSAARREARADASPSALGSIKANIGHTKAAAGVAGLIKAAMAIQTKVLPPTTGCDTPHSELTTDRPMLRILREGELWPEAGPVRAGVSAMGFGGINTHVTIEAAGTLRRRNFTSCERQHLASAQDCELFIFQAANLSELADQLKAILQQVHEMSYAELTDMAALLAAQIKSGCSDNCARAACVASSPEELETNAGRLLGWCEAGASQNMDVQTGAFVSMAPGNPQIAFLFSGQGSPVYTRGGIWSRRFLKIHDLYRSAELPATPSIATETAQPCVVTASLAGLHALGLCGISANAALGHSLGEVTALHWAGACEEEDLLRIVGARGRIMAQTAAPSGSMASIRAGYREVKKRINGDPLAIAAHNSHQQTVVSGDAQAVRRFVARLGSEGISCTILPVSHAFHSPLVANAATSFQDYLRSERLCGLRRRVISTVTGALVAEDADLHALLGDQIVRPVQFAEALTAIAKEADLLIEVGPGAVLAGIAAECTGKPVIALNAGSESLRGLLLAAGAAFALGANIRSSALFEDRFVRPFDLQRRHKFLQNPCETILNSLPISHSRPAPAQVAAPEIAHSGSSMEVLLQLIAQRTELPLANIKPQSRFLDDLHLNSITVSQIILQTAVQLDLPLPAAPMEYANVTIAEAAKTLEALRRQKPTPATAQSIQGAESWIRSLAVEFVEEPLRSVPAPPPPGVWQVLAAHDHPLRDSLEQELRNAPGKGMVCLVPSKRDEQTAMFLLECSQMGLQKQVQQVAFVGSGAAALARALYLEHPELKITVIDAPPDHPQAASWVAQETRCAAGFTQVQYDTAGVRREPRLKVLWPEKTPSLGLGPEDILLVTGGGKGIAAECALALARESKCSLALIGRSEPERDQQLKDNFLRLTQAGVSYRYFAADVSDSDAVAAAIQEIERSLGSVTAVLHGAGTNSPKRLEELTAHDLHETFAPKLAGLRNVLANIHPQKLRLLIAFGSIIARTGLHGEAHYGLVNDWLDSFVERWQQDHPACRCLNLQWSVWAGAGMGQRLGVLESLTRQGIVPLPLDEAIEALKTMLAWEQAPVSCIITSRFGKLPTLQFAQSGLPLLRFLEHIEIYYPGIELVAAADLSVDTDLYIADHAFQGEQLLPAVCGMEAMAQAASVLENCGVGCLEFRNLRFVHPIVVPPNQPVRIRIAALRRRPGAISVVIRCSTTSFHVDHFSAECCWGPAVETKEPSLHLSAENQPLPLDTERDLYGRVLFHRNRFRRVEKYHWLQAGQIMAALSAPLETPWYARHLPPDSVLGNPASRDAALHSIQACIPHKTILPVGVKHIVADPSWTGGCATVEAIERVRDGDDFLYDLTIQDATGRVCEFWEGLHLRGVAPIPPADAWPFPLLGPYLERKLGEFAPSAGLKAALSADCAIQCKLAEMVRRLIGPEATLTHRPDGKPEILGCAGAQISLSHAGPLTLVFAGNATVGCDVEPITPREAAVWEKLLGKEEFALARLISQQCQSPLDTAATLAWTLKESLRKAGAGFFQPLRLDSVMPENWITFAAGSFVAAAFHTRIQEPDSAFALGFVVRRAQ